MISFLLSPVILWIYPRIFMLAVALFLPVVEFWAYYGLGSFDRDGFENWGLLVLPVLCLVSLAEALLVLIVRRNRNARIP